MESNRIHSDDSELQSSKSEMKLDNSVEKTVQPTEKRSSDTADAGMQSFNVTSTGVQSSDMANAGMQRSDIPSAVSSDTTIEAAPEIVDDIHIGEQTNLPDAAKGNGNVAVQSQETALANSNFQPALSSAPASTEASDRTAADGTSLLRNPTFQRGLLRKEKLKADADDINNSVLTRTDRQDSIPDLSKRAANSIDYTTVANHTTDANQTTKASQTTDANQTTDGDQTAENQTAAAQGGAYRHDTSFENNSNTSEDDMSSTKSGSPSQRTSTSDTSETRTAGNGNGSSPNIENNSTLKEPTPTTQLDIPETYLRPLHPSSIASIPINRPIVPINQFFQVVKIDGHLHLIEIMPPDVSINRTNDHSNIFGSLLRSRQMIRHLVLRFLHMTFIESSVSRRIGLANLITRSAQLLRTFHWWVAEHREMVNSGIKVFFLLVLWAFEASGRKFYFIPVLIITIYAIHSGLILRILNPIGAQQGQQQRGQNHAQQGTDNAQSATENGSHSSASDSKQDPLMSAEARDHTQRPVQRIRTLIEGIQIWLQSIVMQLRRPPSTFLGFVVVNIVLFVISFFPGVSIDQVIAYRG